MRTALILAAALVALGLSSPAGAATKPKPAAKPAPSMVSDPYFDLQQMRLAFSHIHSVQAIERFSSGVTATVAYVPTGQPRTVMAANDGQQALLDFVEQPGGDLHADLHKLFTVSGLGAKTVNAEKLWGYHLASLSGDASEDVWVNANYLPIKAHIQVGTESVDVLYGNYDVPVYFASKQ